MKERTKLIIIVLSFLLVYFLPFTDLRMQGAILESFNMLQEYAGQHVLLCLVPAFFIAGAISIFVSLTAQLLKAEKG